MKIFVTGAAGFIGSYLCRALLWRGDEVVGLDNFHEYYPRKCKEFNIDLINLASGRDAQYLFGKELNSVYKKLESYTDKKIVKDRGCFSFIEGDIRDFEFLKDLFEKHKFDAVIHLAAMAGVPLSLLQPRLYTEVNVDGTVNLLMLSSKISVKNFVFASSSSVYGDRNEVPFMEDEPANRPISPYASSKLAGEAFCYAFHHNFKIPVSCLRFFTVYGPLQRPYGMVIQRFINQAYRGIPLTIYGDGSMARDYTYVEDTVSGIISALDMKCDYEIFNLGNSSPVSVLELAKIIQQALGVKAQLNFVDRPSTEVSVTCAGITKARKILEYNPNMNFFEGIRRQVEIFMLMPDWYKRLENV